LLIVSHCVVREFVTLNISSQKKTHLFPANFIRTVHTWPCKCLLYGA